MAYFDNAYDTLQLENALVLRGCWDSICVHGTGHEVIIVSSMSSVLDNQLLQVWQK